MFLFLLLKGTNKRQGILFSSYPLKVNIQEKTRDFEIPRVEEPSSPAASPFRGKVEKKGGCLEGKCAQKKRAARDFFRPKGMGAGKEEITDAPP